MAKFWDINSYLDHDLDLNGVTIHHTMVPKWPDAHPFSGTDRVKVSAKAIIRCMWRSLWWEKSMMLTASHSQSKGSGHAGRGLRLFVFFLCPFMCAAVLGADLVKAFPDAQGWAAHTPGGRGGQILRVTNLNAGGPGSFAEAVQAKGPRIVVFEVGGVIDLQRKSITIREPFVTIAGQTAPSPGITFIRGGINIAAHDVIVQHISVRPGEAGAAKKSGWEVDGMATSSFNIIVDHCSCTWATDENLSASGPRFDGDTVEDWRENTSHRVTFSHCIIA
ncbi:MAG: hypothetical protein K9N55_05485, partial [Phycisphaerae bacterium]|nr:hypothetical protein [Phycisphaerae bacterium]